MTENEKNNPTVSDKNDVAEWLNTDIENVRFYDVEQVSIDLFKKDAMEMLDSFDEFPKDRKRTEKILKEIAKTGIEYPMYVSKDDDFNFVMEGRHRMVAFLILEKKTVPVCYVEVIDHSYAKKPTQKVK